MPFLVPTRICAAVLVAIVASGCGQSSSKKVVGTVTYLEKPVVHGSVTLMGPEGIPFQGQIQPDGRFVVEAVPSGNYQVAVCSDERKRTERPIDRLLPETGKRPTGQKKDMTTPGWFPIPDRYSSFEGSGLSVSVGKGTVSFDIKLTD
jgi:hypothetical protein